MSASNEASLADCRPIFRAVAERGGLRHHWRRDRRISEHALQRVQTAKPLVLAGPKQLAAHFVIRELTASNRTIRLMRIACSRPVDLRPGNGAELRRSPAVPSHRPASTRPTVSPMLSGPV